MTLLSSVSCISSGGGSEGACIGVDLVSSPEKVRMMEAFARAFNRSDHADLDGRCIDVAVHGLSSGHAERLLRDGWQDPDVDVPPPVIWTPAASSWALLLGEESGLIQPTVFTSVARSPLVIAMPQTRVDELGWRDEAIGFDEILALARASAREGGCDPAAVTSEHRGLVERWCRANPGPFTLGKTNPHLSTSGLGALVAQADAAAGRDGLTADQLEDPAVEEAMRAVESSVAHYGDTTLTFLGSWSEADRRGREPYVDAVVVEEKSVIDYNRGDPRGDEPDRRPRPGRPRVPIVAMYPDGGTFYSDNPAFVLGAGDVDWVRPQEERAAEVFVRYLERPEVQRRVVDYGFRPARGGVPEGSELFGERYGVDPAADPAALDVPAGGTLPALLGLWDRVRRNARVLLVFDVSESMGDPAYPGDEVDLRTKLDVAQEAATEALEGEDDDPSLAFSTDMDDLRSVYGREYCNPAVRNGVNDDEVCVVVDLEPYRENRERLVGDIDSLETRNATPLYRTIERAHEHMLGTYDPDRINAVVVLSDGENDVGDLDPEEDDQTAASLLEELGGERPGDESVRVFTIAYGADVDREHQRFLQDVAAATGARSYDATNPHHLEQVFRDVISNF
jgi:Ca-activated chloride channel family protein